MSSTSTNRKWVPLAMVAGTTVVLAVPLLWLLRRRSPSTHQLPTTAVSALNFARGQCTPTTTPTATASSKPSSSSSSLPGFFSAISQSDASTALFATKALGIATCLVAVSGLGMAWGAKSTLGIQDMHEFAHLARETVSTHLPSLSARIYRLPQCDAERAPIQSTHSSAGKPESGSDAQAAAAWDMERVMKQLDSDLENEHLKRFK
ncbi:hypothetical protein APHAL10511_007774 [Amanita phalloides]|nr:hypothetical protein APHAL10511_007774 [Amanita phalloides]